MSKLRKWMMNEERESTSAGSAGSADPAFKLFGKTIDVNATSDSAENASSVDAAPSISQDEVVDGVPGQAEEGLTVDDRASSLGSNGSGTEEEIDMKSNGSVGSEATPETNVALDGIEVGAEEEKQQGEEQENGEHPPRKPDKLVACPRCDSLDTKFCYYNNYNVNQPRHFCKNCQRYWTAGGTLRNVPVGAGRRKNKYGGLQSRQDNSEGSAVATVRADPHDSAQQLLPSSLGSLAAPVSLKVPSLKVPQLRIPGQCSLPIVESPGVSSVTSYCPDSGLSDSMASALSLQRVGIAPQVCAPGSAFIAAGADLSSDAASRLRPKMLKLVDSNGPDMTSESKDECVSSMTTSALETRDPTTVGSSLPQLQPDSYGRFRSIPVADAGGWTSGGTPFSFFNGAWPYGYSVGWSGVGPVPTGAAFCAPPQATLGTVPPAVNGLQWSAPPAGFWTGVWAPGMPGAPSGWNMPQGGWTMPWGPAAAMSVQPAGVGRINGVAPNVSSGNVLGKREKPEGARVEGSLIVPKPMRVGNSEEVARSSVWTNLRAKNPEGINSGGMFKVFQAKSECKSLDEVVKAPTSSTPASMA